MKSPPRLRLSTNIFPWFLVYRWLVIDFLTSQKRVKSIKAASNIAKHKRFTLVQVLAYLSLISGEQESVLPKLILGKYFKYNRMDAWLH